MHIAERLVKVQRKGSPNELSTSYNLPISISDPPSSYSTRHFFQKKKEIQTSAELSLYALVCIQSRLLTLVHQALAWS